MAESTQKQKQEDVIGLLVSDHDEVRGLLKKMEKAKKAEREELLPKLYLEFMVHSDVEEEIVYPAYKEEVGDRDARVDVLESLEEHDIAKSTLEDMQELDVNSEEFDAKFKLLKESIEHHAKEEEDEMFPEFRKAASKTRLQELAKEVLAAKDELAAQYE